MSENKPSESGGFFSRWSQRKQAVRQGMVLPEPPLAAPIHSSKPDERPLATAVPHDLPQPSKTPTPVPTLEDVAKLTPESDFSTFMAQNVPSDIKNAAVKKLFADPHFNIMDGLDIYIGDYNTPDPLPEGMLAKMVGAQFLGLVKAPEDMAQSDSSSADANDSSTPQLPAEPASTESLETHPAPHDHTHLRLQSDDAPAAPEAGSSAG